MDRAKSALGEVGVEAMEDLKDVCSDDELLQSVKGSLSAVDYVKFKKAVKKTKFLEGCAFSSGNSSELSSLNCYFMLQEWKRP